MCASFCASTRILTTRGRVRVEKLRLGDQAITVSGATLPILWIGRRIYGRHFARLNPNSVPVIIKAGALADGVPSRDLCLSPLHNLHIDGVLIPAGQLVNGSSILTHAEMDPISYFHIELPRHAILLAEDTPAESYVDRGDRAKFVSASPNALSDGPPPSWAACAPIMRDGHGVDRVRARIALRAGLTPTDIMDRPQGGPLIGKVEWADHAVVSGWAWLPDYRNTPVVLEVLDRGELIAIAVADGFSAELRRAGIGDGRHAFHVDLPAPLDPRVPHRLVVRRAADGLALPGCPVELAPRHPSSALTQIDLTALVADADPAETRRILDWLEEQVVKLNRILLAPQEILAPVIAPVRRTPVSIVAEPKPRRLKPSLAVQV